MTFISLLLVAALQSASPDPLEAAYGNTLVSTYPDGRTARLWLSRDRTYTGQGRGGRPSAGVWERRGSELCMRQRRPLPLPVRYCTAIVTGGVGTQWKAKAVTGEPITVMLVAGR
jgi:hypothetical protein